MLMKPEKSCDSCFFLVGKGVDSNFNHIVLTPLMTCTHN